MKLVLRSHMQRDLIAADTTRGPEVVHHQPGSGSASALIIRPVKKTKKNDKKTK